MQLVALLLFLLCFCASSSGVMDSEAILDRAGPAPDAILSDPRGFLVVGERGIPLKQYESMLEAIRSSPTFGVQQYFMAIATSEDATEQSLLGAALRAMSRHTDVHWWAVAGHGEGGSIASLLASTMHPRVKSLIMLGALPSPAIGKSLVDKNLYTLVVTGSQDTVTTPEAITASLEAYPKLAVLRTANLTHEGFATEWGINGTATTALIEEFSYAMGFLQYYSLMEEGKQYMESTDKVTVTADEQGRWYTFSPAVVPSAARYRIGIVYFQGAAVPIEAYGNIMRTLASMRYVCIALAAPGNNAKNALPYVEEAMAGQPSVTDWFVGGHSMGGIVASGYAYKTINPPFEVATKMPSVRPAKGSGLTSEEELTTSMLRGVILLASSALPNNFKESARCRALPFLQVYGTLDGGSSRLDDARAYYVDTLLKPYVIDASITAAASEGGSHYGWGHYGYQQPMLVGTQTREAQQHSGAVSVDAWIQHIMKGVHRRQQQSQAH